MMETKTIEIARIKCHYQVEDDTLFMNIEPSKAAAFMEDFFADEIARKEGIEFRHIAYLNLDGNSNLETNQTHNTPRWIYGLYALAGAARVLLICAAIAYFNVPGQWALPLFVLLNFLLGYALGPSLTPAQIDPETETDEAQYSPSPNNEKAAL